MFRMKTPFRYASRDLAIFIVLVGTAIILSALASRRSAHLNYEGHKWRQLFNGQDLPGWDSHLNKPLSSIQVPGLKKDSSGEYTQRLGVNNDPLKVFTVQEEDGAPAIR